MQHLRYLLMVRRTILIAGFGYGRGVVFALLSGRIIRHFVCLCLASEQAYGIMAGVLLDNLLQRIVQV